MLMIYELTRCRFRRYRVLTLCELTNCKRHRRRRAIAVGLLQANRDRERSFAIHLRSFCVRAAYWLVS